MACQFARPRLRAASVTRPYIKLARGDLSRWFTFGAYAGAGLERSDIVRQAIRRAEALMGRDLPNTEIYVVGETPRDIEAAHAAGCTAIAVATGHYDLDALRDAGADHVLETLEEELPIA
jgi:phosphoglycolate phosphatase